MKCRAMTRIMQICMVLMVVVSVFFYAPMEADAKVSVATSAEILEKDNALYNEIMPLSVGQSNAVISCYFSQLWGSESEAYDFSSYLTEGDGLYEVNFKIDTTFKSSRSDTYFRNMNTYMNCSGQYQQLSTMNSSATSSYSFSANRKFYIDSSTPEMTISYKAIAFWTTNPGTVTLTGSYSISNISVTKVNQSNMEDYQNGYNAGYSAGEQAGYGNGYSQGFADGEASVDTDAIYDEAFQAGKDSVDTQSYYDAGYQAGYDAAYSAGYESGYDVGYQSAMDRIENWGADTSDYPLLISESGETFDLQFDFIEEGSNEAVYSDYADYERYYTGIEFNPNHTYRLDFTYHNFSYEYDSFFTSSFSFWLYWGDSSFPLIVGSKDDITTSVFIPGARISNGLRFRCDLGQIESNGSIDVLHYYLKGCYLKLYDMGPSGDTQNHIANQTDQLTNGYDSSQGAAMNEDFKASVNDYQTAEDSLFTSAQTSLDNFTFLDFTSITGMVTALSFVSSIMTRIYNAMGGDTGAAGIILSVLFSIMLVSMAIGLYRFYVSNGKSDNSNKGGD